MDIQAELDRMADEVFDMRRYKTLLEASLQEMQEDDFLIPENEYQQGVAALNAIFQGEQRAALEEMEALRRKNAVYLIKFGFARGLFTALEQYFVEQSQQEPFQKLVADQILHYPEMTRYQEYFDRHEQARTLYAQLEAGLTDGQKEHLVSVDVGWENREYGVLRHSFYLGYCAGLALLQEVAPEDSARRDMADKKLRTECELGLKKAGGDGLCTMEACVTGQEGHPDEN